MTELSRLVTAALAALVLSAALIPMLRRLARRAGVVAPARPDRWGSLPTPLLGGVAIVIGVLAPAAALVPDQRVFVVVAGTLAALALGLFDDIRGLRPTSKLVGQIVLASGLAAGGVRVEIVDIGVVSFFLTLLWVVALMNAMNLVDNMDGLAGGLAAIAGVVLVIGAQGPTAWTGVLAAALVGSSLGFLLFNFPPARIYMGDAGSLALGFVLAALSLVQTNEAASNIGLAIFAPLLALGVPIFDTALVTVVRRIEGRPVSQGGRDHTSHRLAALGLNERETVLILYATAIAIASIGLLSEALGYAFVPIVALVVVGMILFGVFLTEGGPTSPARMGASRTWVIGSGRTLLRYGGEIGLDTVLATVALMSAYLIRFETFGVEVWMPLFLAALPLVVPVQLAFFVLLGVYRILWRFVGIIDVLVIVRAAVVGTIAAAAVVLIGQRELGQSRAVFLIDGMLLALLVIGSRLSLVTLRTWFASKSRTSERRALIVGADETGEFALRLIMRSTDPSYRAAGFLDDDPGKHRRRIHGIPVLGDLSELRAVVRRERIDVVLVALDDRMQQAETVREECSRLGVEVIQFARPL